MRSKLPFTSWSRDPFFEVPQSQNGQKLAIGSNANINQQKVLFLIVHKTMGFATETNSSFILWWRIV